MSRDHWFRRKTWSQQDEAEFFARLKKSRTQFHKAQYLRIQAVYLEDEYPETALQLLDIVIGDFPEPSELAQVWLQKAHCLIALGRQEDAILCFRRVLEHEQVNLSIQTRGYLDFPTFIVANERHELYAEAKVILINNADRLLFPAHHYLWNSAMAIISEFDGDPDSAGSYAMYALDAASQQNSGFRYHPKVGLVKKQDRKIQNQLMRLSKKIEGNS